MRIPKLTPIRTTRETVTAFGGYDHRSVISAGSWYDEQNITADNYPTATVRGKHGALTLDGGAGPVTGIFEANGREGYTRYASSGTPAADHGTVSFYDPAGTLSTVDLGLSSALKRFVRMGAYLIILPDKKWINTADAAEYGDMSDFKAEFEEDEGEVVFATVYKNGSAMSYTASSTAPVSPADKALWYDTTETILKQYNAAAARWVAYTDQIYTKITLPGRVPRLVDLEGFDLYLYIEANRFSEYVTGKQPRNGYYRIEHATVGSGSDYTTSIVIPWDVCDGTVYRYANVMLEFKMPDMDFVVESGNRLWGCKWGKTTKRDEEGDEVDVIVNEIYATALGSFKEWRVYEGTDSDSYAASVGSDGPFTGAVSFQGRPVFFKERCMHQVYGSYPSAYQIVSTECHGIEAGSDQSAALVDNILYYKSPEGFAAFDGSLPVMVDAPLGGVRYHNVSAGGHDRKYIATAIDEGGTAHVLIYNIRLGLWEHAEARSYDATGLAACTLWASIGDDMCYIDAVDSFATVRTWYGTGTKDTAPVKWYAETGDLGLGDLSGKYVILLSVRIRLAIGSVVTVRIRYDDGPWEHVTRKAGTSLLKFPLPVRVKRCDHFRLRLEGEGDAQIYAIEKTIQGGGRK